MTEIEIKLAIAPERVSAVKAEVQRGQTTRIRMQAQYFDTPDNALANRHIALRLRKEGKNWVQTVKAAGADAMQRLEHNVELGAVPAGVALQPQPELHAGTPVGELLLHTLAEAAQPLQLTYSTDIWRTARPVRIPQGKVELAFDSGRIDALGADGRRRKIAISELELELLAGDVQGLCALASRWVQRHGLWVSTLSKAQQGERLRQQVKKPAITQAQAPAYGADLPSGAGMLQAVLAASLAHILPNATEVAQGRQEAALFQELRQGVARLRCVLEELAPLVGGVNHPVWEVALQELHDKLNDWHLHGVTLPRIQTKLHADQAPALALLPASVMDAAGVAEAVRGKELQRTLVDLMGWSVTLAQAGGKQTKANANSKPSPRPMTQAGGKAALAIAGCAASDGAVPVAELDGKAVREYLRQRLHDLHHGALHNAKKFTQLDLDQQLQVLDKLQRLLHLVQLAAPWLTGKAAQRYRKKLQNAVQALEGWHAQVQVLQVFRTRAQTDANAWFGAGWLAARQRRWQKRCAKRLCKLAKLPALAM